MVIMNIFIDMIGVVAFVPSISISMDVKYTNKVVSIEGSLALVSSPHTTQADWKMHMKGLVQKGSNHLPQWIALLEKKVT